MKNTYLFALIAALSPFVSAKAETLYYEGTGNWNEASHWWTDSSGTPAEKAPDSATDVLISGVALSGTVNTGGVNIKSLTFDGTATFGNTQDIGFYDGFTIGGDLTYNSTTGGNMLGFIGTNNTFNLGGNLTVDASSAINKRAWLVFFQQGNSDTRIGKINIGGDIEIIGGSGSTQSVLTLNAKDTVVSGKVKLTGNNDVLQLTRSMRIAGTFTNNFTSSGLDGTGTLVISATMYGGDITSTPKIIQNMIFTNATNSSFSGVSKGQFNDAVTNIDSTSELNIEMNASVATATQTLRLKKGSYDTVADNVAVKNGVLNLYGATTFGALTLGGGELAAASESGSSSGYDIGKLAFTSGTWLGGKIAVEIASEDTYDTFAFTGKLDTPDASKLGLDLAFDADDMAAYIEAGEGQAIFSDMITYADGSSIEGAIISGVVNGFNYEAVFGSTGMTLTMTNVPEPSTIAAILGVCALLFAYSRRRK